MTEIINMTGNPCHIVDEYNDVLVTAEPCPVRLQPYHSVDHVRVEDEALADGCVIPVYESDFDPDAHTLFGRVTTSPQEGGHTGACAGVGELRPGPGGVVGPRRRRSRTRRRSR